jgi:hypothetical protein
LFDPLKSFRALCSLWIDHVADRINDGVDKWLERLQFVLRESAFVDCLKQSPG